VNPATGWRESGRWPPDDGRHSSRRRRGVWSEPDGRELLCKRRGVLVLQHSRDDCNGVAAKHIDVPDSVLAFGVGDGLRVHPPGAVPDFGCHGDAVMVFPQEPRPAARDFRDGAVFEADERFGVPSLRDGAVVRKVEDFATLGDR
jgi:hypothetical protein